MVLSDNSVKIIQEKHNLGVFCLYFNVGADNCRSRTTCRECIGVARCAWCSQEVILFTVNISCKGLCLRGDLAFPQLVFLDVCVQNRNWKNSILIHVVNSSIKMLSGVCLMIDHRCGKGEGRGQVGHSLPLPIPLFLSSHSFVYLCHDFYPSLYNSSLLVNKNEQKMGFWQGVPKCFIWSWPFSGVASFMGGEVIFSGWTLLQASFHWPGYLSLSIDSNISPIIIIFACCTSRHIRLSHCLPNLPCRMSLP